MVQLKCLIYRRRFDATSYFEGDGCEFDFQLKEIIIFNLAQHVMYQKSSGAWIIASVECWDARF